MYKISNDGGRPAFEFDMAKSNSNKRKHGIDFVEAQALWDDERRVEILARTVDEPRFVVIGRIAGTFWSAVTTDRQGRTRLISVRQARPEEVALYEG
ncbi:MAG: BrnT family toxin [Krumholzibacteria bacterium]|nr:BrnT family toxin [Candidatus Krumholzibacteria bacterium]